MDGVAAVGTTTKYAREDHVHPSDTSKAALTQVVRYDTAQALTAAQQVQARANVYAAPFDAMAYSGMQINGSMDVSQENGAAGVSVSGISKYIVDGWLLSTSGPQVMTGGQTTIAPPGYINSLNAYVTTANASPAAGNYCFFVNRIEGSRIARLGWGTASAASIAIGFWVYANRPGNYSGSLTNGAGNRSCPFTFTISAANTFEYKTVTLPGDTGGSWPKDNSLGLQIIITMMAGSTYLGPAGTWAATLLLGVTGTTNGVAATTDSMIITGVVVLPGIEVPSAARSPLIMRPFDQELLTCQRYYEKTNAYIVAPGNAYGSFNGGGALYAIVYATFTYPSIHWHFMTRKRVTPTVVAYSPQTGASGMIRNGSSGADVAAIIEAVGEGRASLTINGVSTSGVSQITAHATADARL
jgi:hypothetical protein